MSKIIFLLWGLTLAGVGLSALDLRVGPLASMGNTRAFEAVLEGPTDWIDEDLRPEAGLEVGYSGSHPQLLVPVGLMWESHLERGWSWGASVHALTGVYFNTGETAFLWGAEAELRGEWSWSPGIGLGWGAGVRYAGSVWEVPFHAVVEFALGGEDTLEPLEKKEGRP